METLFLFLLFFAVLAFGWFYLQRAKARDAGKSAIAPTTPPTNAAPSDRTVSTTTDDSQT